MRKDMPYSLLALALLFIFANDNYLWNKPNGLGWWEGFALIVLFVTYMLHTFWDMKTKKSTPEDALVDSEEEEIEVLGGLKTFAFILIGIAGLIIGGKLVVDNAVSMAEKFNVSKKIIGLTILAAGTSLPELATSCVAAFNKKSDLAVGNVVGSNIFNILLVLGSTALVSTTHEPLAFDVKINIDMLVMLLGFVLMIVFMYTFKRSKIDPSEGVILLILFAGYGYYIYTQTQIS